MATKVAPKQTTKETVAPKSADKEKLAAERAKLIEKSVPAVLKPIEAGMQAEAKVKECFFDTVEAVKEVAEKNELTRDEAKLVIKMAVAEANDVKVEDITVAKNASLTAQVSRVLNLAVPKDEKIAKEIEKALEKDVPIVALHKVASGGMKASDAAKSLGRGGNTKAKSKEKAKHGKAVIEDADKLENEVVALLGRATAGGLDSPEIITALLSAFVGMEAAKGDINEDTISEAVNEALSASLATAKVGSED